MTFEPDFIIHSAAETDHEYCDENPAQCYLVNSIGTGNMARLAVARKIPIIYISAASIFDGKKGKPYHGWDVPNPINHYNASKFYGELLVRQHRLHYILRCGWMFGGGQSLDKKFVNKIYQKIKRGDKSIDVCDDCFGSPTYAEDVANYIRSIIYGGKVAGVYNCANYSETAVSRYDFAQEIVRHLKVDVVINPVKIDSLKEEFPCKRTNYEVLANGGILRSWQHALGEYLDANYQH